MKFSRVVEHGYKRWVSGEYFITLYSPLKLIHTSRPYYMAYRAVEKIPAGRMPWTVNNIRLHRENEPSYALKDAIALCEEHARGPK